MSRALLLFVFLCILAFSCVKDNVTTPQVQLKIDTAIIRKFLTDNSIVAQRDPSGYWYTVDTIAVGPYPVLTDSVMVSFRALLIPSLKPIDSSSNSNRNAYLLSSVIAGIQQGLLRFPAGSYGRLYIPSGLAYGATQHNAIPAISNLLYEIKLDKVWGTHLASDVAAIDAYLLTIAAGPTKDPSGIRFIDSASVKTTKPVLGDDILVTYTGYVLGADTTFVSVTSPVQLALNDQIAGWKIVLPQITQGSTVIMYIPSSYAYGSNASAVPANSNLWFRLKLDSVIHH